MVCKVVPGNVYALFGRYCRPHSSSITSSILNWHGRLFAALVGHHGPIGMRLSFPHPLLVLIGHVEVPLVAFVILALVFLPGLYSTAYRAAFLA